MPASIELTYNVLVSGSKDAPPQFAPPLVPGNKIVALSPIGVYKPPNAAPSVKPAQYALDSGVMSVNSSGLMLCLANGGGLSGCGCVGHACAPGVSLAGTSRSSISNSGLPGTRSKMKAK